MRFIIRFIQKLLVLASIGILILGGCSVWTGIANRQRVSTDAMHIEGALARSKWLTITNCELSPVDAFGWTNRFSPSVQELLIPLRAAPEKSDSPILLLIATKDPKLIESFNELLGTDNFEAKLKLVTKTPEKFRALRRDVSGLIRESVTITDDETKKLRQTIPSLTANFVILDEGSSPSILGGLRMIAFGFVLFLIGVGLEIIKGKMSGKKDH